jgi:predicted small lipoprotein YifL
MTLALLVIVAVTGCGRTAPAPAPPAARDAPLSPRTSYDLGRRHVELHPRYLDDWLDLKTLLCAVNDQISASGVQLELLQPFDQTAYVVAVTRAEHARATALLPKLRRDACVVGDGPLKIGRGFESEVLKDITK